MRDYNYRKNWNDLLTPEIVKKLTLIHEYMRTRTQANGRVPEGTGRD